MKTGGRILVVDDDQDFVQAMAALLEHDGYAVLTALNGREGVLRARQELPDLILLDVMMDERTEGFFVAQELRRIPELARVPIFIVSSVYTEQPGFTVDPARAWLGHDAFYRKPVDTDALLADIRAALSARSGLAVRGATP
jgi:two-component system alkaline phosphatase synthesis response regulator PhoP